MKIKAHYRSSSGYSSAICGNFAAFLVVITMPLLFQKSNIITCCFPVLSFKWTLRSSLLWRHTSHFTFICLFCIMKIIVLVFLLVRKFQKLKYGAFHLHKHTCLKCFRLPSCSHLQPFHVWDSIWCPKTFFNSLLCHMHTHLWRPYRQSAHLLLPYQQHFSLCKLFMLHAREPGICLYAQRKLIIPSILV